MKDKLHVVIVGAGFGGLRAAKIFKDQPAVSVTVIDKNNHHLFQPLLYQVATSGLTPADIAVPIRFILRHQQNVNVLMDEVLKIDTTKKYVILADQIISYDYLIVAAGVTHNYFGNNHWATWPRDSKPYPKQQKFEAEFYGPLKPQRSAQTTIRNKI